MNLAYLLIGGNLGDRGKNLQEARNLLASNCGQITAESGIYETEAWGNRAQPGFLNQALELSTGLNAQQLLRRILKLEKKMGRARLVKLGPRIIDIDILLFNDEVIDFSFLQVPHPEMANRRFALQPLAEIAPGKIHPVLKKSVKQLLDECPDKLEVIAYH